MGENADNYWRIVSPSGEEFTVTAGDVTLHRHCTDVEHCNDNSVIDRAADDHWTFSAIVRDQ